MGEHTPGPWKVDRTLTGLPLIYAIGRAGRRVTIARLLFGKIGQPSEDQARANAHLIAAATEMLVELKRLHAKTGEQATADMIAKVEGPHSTGVRVLIDLNLNLKTIS